MAAAQPDWQSLLHQTDDLVAQDYHQFPKVDRNIQQLQSYAGSLRAKTNKFRTLNNQIAATRLLAQQGFDASRLTQDVTTLEIQPTIEDVFHADTSSVEEYLKQVEEATILAAIQEAQQDTVTSFEHFMEDCMARDWAANKRQLFGLIAPHSGPMDVGTASGRWAAPAGATGAGGAASGLRLPPKEQAYVNVIQQANQAAVSGNQSFNLLAEFTQACKANEDKTHETVMSSLWSLLSDILKEVKAQNVSAASTTRFTEALLQGARGHLERGHAQHTRNMLLRHKLQAERGADPEQLREVQAYIQVKYASRGAMDFRQPGGHDTAWIQVYLCLRNGWHDAACRAAQRVHDLPRDLSLKTLLEEWLRSGYKLADRPAAQLARECERLLRDKAALKAQLRYPYMVLVCALLAGDNRSLDALTATLASLSLPSVLSTIEDFMWCKLVVVNVGGTSGSQSGGFALHGGVSGIPPFTLTDLHNDLNRWPAAYYSKQGKEPLLYVTVLLLSQQFHAALRFLWKDETTKMYRADAVHMAIVMHQENALAVLPGDGSVDVGAMIQAYGRKFVHQDSSIALQYYMLASVVRGNSIAVKGQMLRELLTESRDFGTLLGGGGAAGSGALAAYVPSVQERKQLFEAVAYECQVAAQPEEAIELYMAADRPRQALAILNQQLSSSMDQGVTEAAVAGAAAPARGAADTAKHVITRGRDACAKIGTSADVGSRREVEAFANLNAIWELLLATRQGRQDLALQKLHELSFLPLEKSRVEGCIRAAQQLHPAVQDRLQDVLAAAADIIDAQRAGASRDKLAMLRLELDALCMFANGITHRVSKQVYQKLCSVAASFLT